MKGKIKTRSFEKLKLEIWIQASSIAGFILATFNLYHNINQQHKIDDNCDAIRALTARIATLEGSPTDLSTIEGNIIIDVRSIKSYNLKI